MLFDPRVHEPLVDADWDPLVVEHAIRTIALDAEQAFRGAEWWPVHPIDVDPGDPPSFHGVYLGAAGVVWALQRLTQAGLHDPRIDHARLAEEVWASYLRQPEFNGPHPSIWMGEGGIALVAWLLQPRQETVDRLAQIVSTEPQDETLEFMWGTPGLLLIADVLLTHTGEARWAEAWQTMAHRLLARYGENVPGFWTQRLYGYGSEILGPVHGLVGVVAMLTRRPELLETGSLLAETIAVLSRLALREGEQANWAPSLQEGLRHREGFIRTQWCHGTPGIVTSLASLPPNPELDGLLLAGSELTWLAGPLRKGANLCHGTAGNGFALLKLFTRTGDELWLDRARRFAMHCLAQVAATRDHYGHGHFSLWTGDLGTAVYLQQCLNAASELPAFDSW